MDYIFAFIFGFFVLYGIDIFKFIPYIIRNILKVVISTPYIVISFVSLFSNFTLEAALLISGFLIPGYFQFKEYKGHKELHEIDVSKTHES